MVWVPSGRAPGGNFSINAEKCFAVVGSHLVGSPVGWRK